MFGGISVPELIIVLIIILLVFGAGKLPEIGSGLGKAIKNFKNASSSKKNEEQKEQKTINNDKAD
ncbi:MAG: twin-arginine translocase TatA/TatE family subunit [Deltaproteobacteria bacterium]|nr:MAG: twin-arginine translocase TatA/TatE family subunit [Deltaproteobacteria bacterium]